MSKLSVTLIIFAALSMVAADRPPTCPPGQTGSDCLPYRPSPIVEKDEPEIDQLPFILPATGGYIRTIQMTRR